MIVKVDGTYLGIREWVDGKGNTRKSAQLAVEDVLELSVSDDISKDLNQFAVGSPVSLKVSERQYGTTNVKQVIEVV